MGQRHVCTFRLAQRAAYRTAISAAQTCLNLKRVRWFGVLFFQNFNKEISYFLTDNLPLVLKLHEICSVDSQKNH